MLVCGFIGGIVYFSLSTAYCIKNTNEHYDITHSNVRYCTAALVVSDVTESLMLLGQWPIINFVASLLKLTSDNKNLPCLRIVGGFPIGVKTKKRYLISCCYHNFIL